MTLLGFDLTQADLQMRLYKLLKQLIKRTQSGSRSQDKSTIIIIDRKSLKVAVKALTDMKNSYLAGCLSFDSE